MFTRNRNKTDLLIKERGGKVSTSGRRPTPDSLRMALISSLSDLYSRL